MTTAAIRSRAAAIRDLNAERILNIAKRKHLDDPVTLRYGYWVKDAVTDKFGTTLFGRPADLGRSQARHAEHAAARPRGGDLLALLFAIIIGVYSAIRQYSVFDYSATTFSFLGFALPVFWLALMLQILFTNIFLKWHVRIFYTAPA